MSSTPKGALAMLVNKHGRKGKKRLCCVLIPKRENRLKASPTQQQGMVLKLTFGPQIYMEVMWAITSNQLPLRGSKFSHPRPMGGDHTLHSLIILCV